LNPACIKVNPIPSNVIERNTPNARDIPTDSGAPITLTKPTNIPNITNHIPIKPNIIFNTAFSFVIKSLNPLIAIYNQRGMNNRDKPANDKNRELKVGMFSVLNIVAHIELLIIEPILANIAVMPKKNIPSPKVPLKKFDI